MMNRDRNWGDDDEDEDYETAVDANGIKERVKTITNNRGQKIKTVQRIKVQEIKRRTPKGILERKNLPKFGDATRETDYRDCVSKEVGIMEYPGEEDVDADVDPLAKPLPLTGLTNMQLAREAASKEEEEEVTNERTIEFKPRQDAPETTIRVSNLSKSVTEADLKDLFGAYGRVSKVSLPRITNDKGVKEVRGFAYVAFDHRAHAESAMEALDGRGYDHLILKLEWAKPPTGGSSSFGGGGGFGSGLSSGYVSGYGKQLAQDTKEKAVFTSHNAW